MHCLSRRPRSYLLNSYSDFKEIDEIARESYETAWLDLLIETRPEYRTTLVEKDSVRKESYESKQVIHFTVRRSPNQTIQMGIERQPPQLYHLPYKKTLPIPIFTPRDISQHCGTHTPSQDQTNMNSHSEPSFNGVCLPSVTIQKPKVVKVHGSDFRASTLVSPHRDTLHVQRRE
ncbi:hypothetical protein DNTS_021472 [Danionella cerebrum]|uniref:Uncharacterized protein n=1 Tax=Danionella cerebrum TaxID=2873325 RepID=A0A553R001_9TELE|nr:hypothetical protein DNTS_021472 [Danionella translucida]